MNGKSDACGIILFLNQSVSVPKPAVECFWYGTWWSTDNRQAIGLA